MPTIVEQQFFDGAEALIDRLGLDELLTEVRGIIAGFELLVEEKEDSNGAGALRKVIDGRFHAAGGWVKKTSGGVDWVKDRRSTGVLDTSASESSFRFRAGAI
jgi:hypothetical protein